MDVRHADALSMTFARASQSAGQCVLRPSIPRPGFGLDCTPSTSVRATLDTLMLACRSADPHTREIRDLVRTLQGAWSADESRFRSETDTGEDLSGYAIWALGAAAESSIDRATRLQVLALYDAILPTLQDE